MKVVEFPQGTDLMAGCTLHSGLQHALPILMAKIKSGESPADRRNYRAKLVVERLTGKPVQTFLNDTMKLGHRARATGTFWPRSPHRQSGTRKSACACTMNVRRQAWTV